MKIRCAWCGQLLGFRCPFCGERLKITNHPDGRGKVLLCDTGISQIYFTDTSTMAVSHTICLTCRSRFSHGLGNHDVATLSDEDFANLALLDTPDEKRGPTGVAERRNTPNSGTAKKRGVGHQPEDDTK
jgi:hypothetical protein